MHDTKKKPGMYRLRRSITTGVTLSIIEALTLKYEDVVCYMLRF